MNTTKDQGTTRAWWEVAATTKEEEKDKNKTPATSKLKLKQQDKDNNVATLDPSAIVCSFCGLPQTTVTNFEKFKCPCKSTRYCNKICQKKHWKKHRKNCKRLIKEMKLSETTANAIFIPQNSVVTIDRSTGTVTHSELSDLHVQELDDIFNGKEEEEDEEEDEDGDEDEDEEDEEWLIKAAESGDQQSIAKLRYIDKMTGRTTPTVESRPMYCWTCGKPHNPPSVKLIRCNGCQCAYYCNRECQREDWKHGIPKHKEMCKDLRS